MRMRLHNVNSVLIAAMTWSRVLRSPWLAPPRPRPRPGCGSPASFCWCWPPPPPNLPHQQSKVRVRGFEDWDNEQIENRRPWKHFLFTSRQTSPLERWRPGRGGRGACREWSLQMKLINSLELWKSGVKTLINSSLKAKLHSVAISSFYLPQIIACDPRFQKIQFS